MVKNIDKHINKQKDIEEKLVFLTNMWYKLYYLKYDNCGKSEMHVCNRMHYKNHIFSIIAQQLNGLHTDEKAVPSFKIATTHMVVNHRFTCSLKSSLDTTMTTINLLIWAIASFNRDNFGLFLYTWNHAMLLQANHKSACTISRIVFHGDTIPDGREIKNILIKRANDISFTINNSHASNMLHQIIASHNWTQLIYQFAIKYKAVDFTIAELKNHMDNILNHGTYNSCIVAYLNNLHIISGIKAQQLLHGELEDGVASFKFTYEYSVALSKISDPNAMYYCNGLNVHRANGKKLLKLINHHRSIKVQYHKLLKQQSNINRKVDNFRYKYNISK